MNFEEVRSVDNTDIDTNYTPIGDPLENPARIIFVQNMTDEALMFSIDGETDHFPLPSMGFMLLDAAANQTHNQGAFFPKGMTLYVTEIGNPTTGAVYFSVVYATTASNI
jgi:hypothetical protein